MKKIAILAAAVIIAVSCSNGTKADEAVTGEAQEVEVITEAADYELVGNGNYGNFDVRAGKVEEPEAVRVDKISTILLNNFPSDAEGQKYIVTYNIYNGAAGIWSLAVIKEGNAYVKQ